MPSRYAPLVAFLQAQSVARVTLTYREVERLIGGPLPRSAYLDSWWTNSPRSWGGRNAPPWVRAGWRVDGPTVRRLERTVTFVRTTHAAAPPPT